MNERKVYMVLVHVVGRFLNFVKFNFDFAISVDQSSELNIASSHWTLQHWLSY